jgi:hypothetical protein
MRHWTCRKCKHVNVRTSSRRCNGCGEDTKRAERVSKTARVLRELSAAEWRELHCEIHSVDVDQCGICLKRSSEVGRLYREHNHTTGEARGLACFRCNKVILGRATELELRRAVAYLERVALHWTENAP